MVAGCNKNTQSKSIDSDCTLRELCFAKSLGCKTCASFRAAFLAPKGLVAFCQALRGRACGTAAATCCPTKSWHWVAGGAPTQTRVFWASALQSKLGFVLETKSKNGVSLPPESRHCGKMPSGPLLCFSRMPQPICSGESLVWAGGDCPERPGSGGGNPLFAYPNRAICPGKSLGLEQGGFAQNAWCVGGKPGISSWKPGFPQGDPGFGSE